MAFFAQGRYDRALDDYLSAIELGGAAWSGARVAYSERGRALAQLGRHDEAIQNYAEAAEKFKDYPDALFDLAFLQLEHKQFEEAIQNLEKVIKAKFRTGEATSNLGLAQYSLWVQQGSREETRTKVLEEALGNLEKAVRLNPNLVLGVISLAKVYEEMGSVQAAIQLFTDALERVDRTSKVEHVHLMWLRRGNLYMKQYNYVAAAEDYRAAIKKLPSDAMAHHNLGIALSRLAESDSSNIGKAIQALNKAIEIAPRLASAYLALGEMLMLTNDSSAAEQAFTTVVALSEEARDLSGAARAHLQLGRLYLHHRREHDYAERELTQAREDSKNSDDLVYAQATYEFGWLEMDRARVKMDQGRVQQAIGHFSASSTLFEVLNEWSARAEANLQLGHAYMVQARALPLGHGTALESQRLLQQATQTLEKAMQDTMKLSSWRDRSTERRLRRDIQLALKTVSLGTAVPQQDIPTPPSIITPSSLTTPPSDSAQPSESSPNGEPSYSNDTTHLSDSAPSSEPTLATGPIESSESAPPDASTPPDDSAPPDDATSAVPEMDNKT
jgi:tetratricopeptide (TPR) repeat protein